MKTLQEQTFEELNRRHQQAEIMKKDAMWADDAERWDAAARLDDKYREEKLRRALEREP